MDKPAQDRLTWDEMRRYWDLHSSQRANVDPATDPDGLANVCYVNAPIWRNRYHAEGQRRAFDALSSRLPRPNGPARALDVGCGTARWSRLLSSRGFKVTGIDLQGELLEANRRRYPALEFQQVALQEFYSDQPFDLAVTVTVLQHLPPSEQDSAVARLADLVRGGGRVLMLENIRDHAPHVFSRSVGDWRALLERHGFELDAVRRYDFSPFMSGLGALRKLIRDPSPRRVSSGGRDAVDDYNRGTPAARTPFARVKHGLARAVMTVDHLLEPLLQRLDPPLPAGHAALLFVRRADGGAATEVAPSLGS